MGVGGEGSDVCLVAGEDGPAGFSECDDDRVDCRSVSRASAQFGCAPCGALGDDCVDDAGLEESVRGGVSAAVTLQRFDEYDGRSDRWPEPVVAKCADECECSWRALGEAADASAVVISTSQPV